MNLSFELEEQLCSFLDISKKEHIFSNENFYSYFLYKFHKKENMKTIDRRHCSNMSIMHGYIQVSTRLQKLFHKTIYDEYNDKFINCMIDIFDEHSVCRGTNVLLYNMSYKKHQMVELNRKYSAFLVPFTNDKNTAIWQILSAIVFHCLEQQEYLQKDGDRKLTMHLGKFIDICNELSIALYGKLIVNDVGDYLFTE
jgi:hypothetical protein